MIVEIVQIPTLTFSKVHFYSVRLEGKAISEYRDFQIRMVQKGNQAELAEINRHIENIGKKYGAYPNQFRDEGAADGLPPPFHHFIESDDPDDFGLRLYCIRLSPSVVILLNGDRKTNRKAGLCDNCKSHFAKANALAKKITQAITDGYMEVDDEEKDILLDEDFELTL